MVKKITKPETLLTHIHPMHEGQRDFTCESKYEFCGKSFSQFNNLKTHTNIIHNDHKDYKCEFCGKLFSTKGNLKQHTQKDYKCQSIYQ